MLSSPFTHTTAAGRESPTSREQRALLAAGAGAWVAHLGLHGSLDQQALARSLLRLIQRHEVLRTVLRMADSSQGLDQARWVQFVCDGPPRPILELNHDHLGEEEQQRRLAVLAEQLRDSCASSSSEALLSIALIRHSPETWVCLLAASELILDSFSFELILDDLQSIYGFESGAAPELAEPGLQYAEWVLWRGALERAESRADLAPRWAAPSAESNGWHAPEEPEPATAYTQRLLEELPPESSLLRALAELCAQRGLSAPALLLSGRPGEEPAGTLGPLAIAEEENSPPLPLASCRTPVLLAPRPLAVTRAFAPGVEAQLLKPAAQAPTLGRAGAMLTVRPLIRPSPAEADAGAVSLALWSRRLSGPEMEAAADALLAILHSVGRSPSGVSSAIPLHQPAPSVALPDPRARAVRPAADAGRVIDDAPQDDTERMLAEIWATVLQTPHVGRHENFFDLGGHSLLAVRIGTRIERAFRKEVPLNAILELPTIAEFAHLLRAEASSPRPGQAAEGKASEPMKSLSALATAELRHRLVTLREPGELPAGATAPLFWIPGGRAISVLALREVSLHLGPGRAVYGIESRLPQQGESFLSVPDRAREYLEVIRKRQPRGPYLLAGFCVGGMVAFEMAQQLLSQGEQVGFLGLIQASTPGFPATPGLRRRMERQRHLYLARTMLAFLMLRLNPWARRKPREHQQVILDRVVKLVNGWVGTSSQLPEPTQQSNGQAMRAYRPDPYPGRVSIYLAEDCFESAGIAEELDPRRGWVRIAASAEVDVMPGDHLSMLTQGPARALAAAIDRALPR